MNLAKSNNRVEVWPAEVKDGDLRNLLHKIEGLVSHRRPKAPQSKNVRCLRSGVDIILIQWDYGHFLLVDSELATVTGTQEVFLSPDERKGQSVHIYLL